MRRLIAILLSIFISPLAEADNGYIQSTSCHSATSAVACAFGSNVTAGNTLIISCDGESFAVTGTTDTNSNTYSFPVADQANGSGHHYRVGVAANVGGGATTVTCSAAGGSGMQASISEYASTATTGAYDVSSSSNPVSGASLANTTSGSATTTVANDLMYETCLDYDNTITSPNGTVRENYAFDQYQMTQDAIVVSPSSYASTFTTTAANIWGCIEIAFKLTAGPVPLGSVTINSGGTGSIIVNTGGTGTINL